MKAKLQKTFSPTPGDIEREWHVVDADGVPLGRVASEVAQLLRGKHKPKFAPHMDMGDYVIVLNAEKVAVTGNKETDKIYYRHSGYPGGIRSETVETVRERYPERLIVNAVKGMLPKNRLGRATLGKLRVYAGAEHPHRAQDPKPYALISRRSEA
jgi:large subunit ribosomal protein L13